MIPPPGTPGFENEKIHPDDRSIDEGGLTYLEKEEKGVLAESEARWAAWKAKAWIPEGVERAADWTEVVQWVKKRGEGLEKPDETG